jgi:hypothetical protein
MSACGRSCAGHDHIGEQQVEMDAALGDGDRFGRIGGLQGSVTKMPPLIAQDS